MRVLVTGGSGYIGSHTCVQLLLQGHEVVKTVMMSSFLITSVTVSAAYCLLSSV